MLDNDLAGLLNYPETDIEVGGHRAFATAKILHDYKVYVLSNLTPDQLSRMNFIPIKDVSEAVSCMRRDYGDGFTAYLVPDGTSILPVVNGAFKS
jgi:nickel-dependent lactate racemase